MEGENDLAPDAGLEEHIDAPVEGVVNEDPQPISVEDLATEMGWTPQESWRGPADKWKPADEFLRRTVDVNRNLTGKLKSLEDTVSNMARTSAQITEQAVAEAREKAIRERQEAFDAGDRAAFDEADKKLKSLVIDPIVPPEVKSFQERNAGWFNKDQDATTWAVNRAGELANQGIGQARQLQIVEREAKQLFPELFEEAPKPKPAPLSQPGNRGAALQSKGFASLPADVKSAALEYEKRGIVSKDEYAKLYYEQQGVGA